MEELLFRGHPEVVDADLADYFGSIPHADLLKSVARRIVDRRVLHLIKMWLDGVVTVTGGVQRVGEIEPQLHATATASCHRAAASALKIRSVDRETRCR